MRAFKITAMITTAWLLVSYVDIIAQNTAPSPDYLSFNILAWLGVIA